MRLLVATVLLTAVSACVAAPPPVVVTPAPVASASTAPLPSAEPSAPPTASPTPTLAPLTAASDLPSADPALATPSPTPTPSPSPSGTPAPLDEATHGDKAFPSPPSGRVLSLSSAIASAGAGPTTAIGAIDGRLYTEWNARGGVGASTQLTLDLGASRRFSKVDLLPDASPAVDCFFNVEVSDDGQAWRTLAAGKGTGSNATPVWGTASFEPVSTRWLRVVPTSWGTSWVAVWELRLRE